MKEIAQKLPQRLPTGVINSVLAQDRQEDQEGLNKEDSASLQAVVPQARQVGGTDSANWIKGVINKKNDVS